MAGGGEEPDPITGFYLFHKSESSEWHEVSLPALPPVSSSSSSSSSASASSLSSTGGSTSTSSGGGGSFSSQFNLTQLSCGRRYHLYLIAFNDAGRGPPSEVISAKTDGAR